MHPQSQQPILGYGGLLVLTVIAVVADRSPDALNFVPWNIFCVLGVPWIYFGAIRPRLIVDRDGLTIVNFVRTIRVSTEDIETIDGGMRSLRVDRKHGKAAVNVWAVQTAQATRYLRRAGFSDHVAEVLDAALWSGSFQQLAPLATREPLGPALVMGVTAAVVVVSLGIRLVAGS